MGLINQKNLAKFNFSNNNGSFDNWIQYKIKLKFNSSVGVLKKNPF